MKKMLVKTTILSSIILLGACDNANGKSSATAGGLNEEQVREIVASYIDENPEAIIASLEKMQLEEAKKQQEAAKNAVKENRSKLLESKHSAAFGDLDSKNYIVEFFDYNCGYCKRSQPTVEKLIDTQKGLKVVLIELPVLGPSSELAASAAVVVQLKRPEKYREFHEALMKHNGKKDLSVINQIARDLDIRDIKFAEEIREHAVVEAIEKNRALADTLGIRGTPAFVINDEILPGAAPYEQILSILEETKK